MAPKKHTKGTNDSHSHDQGKTFFGISKPTVFSILSMAIMSLFWGPGDAYLSVFLSDFSDDYATVGWLKSLQKTMPFLVALPLGIMADKGSPRKIIMSMLLLGLVWIGAYYLAGLWVSITVLAVGLLLNGAVSTIREISADTYVKRITPREQLSKAFSLYTWRDGLWGLGFIGGSLLLPYLELYEFFPLAIIGCLVAFFVHTRLPDAKKQFALHFPKIHKMSLKKRMNRGIHALYILDRRAHFMLIISFLCAFTTGLTNVYVPLLIDDLQYGREAIGLVIGGAYVGLLFIPFVSKYVLKLGTFLPMILGIILAGSSFFAIYAFAHVSIFVLFLALYAHLLFFWLGIKPLRNGTLAAFTPQSMQGEVSGIQFMLYNIASITGGVFFGYVADFFGLTSVFLGMAAVYVIMLVMLVYLYMKYEYKKTATRIHLIPSLRALNYQHFGHMLSKDTHILVHDIDKDIEKIEKDMKKEIK